MEIHQRYIAQHAAVAAAANNVRVGNDANLDPVCDDPAELGVQQCAQVAA